MTQQLSAALPSATAAGSQSTGTGLSVNSKENQDVEGGAFLSELEQAISSEEFEEELMATMPEGTEVAETWQSLVESGKPLPQILAELLATPEGEAHLKQLLSLNGEGGDAALSAGSGEEGQQALLQYIAAALGLKGEAENLVDPAATRSRSTQNFLDQRGNPLLATKGNLTQAGSSNLSNVEGSALAANDLRGESGQELKQVQDAVRQAIQAAVAKEGQLKEGLDLNLAQNALNQRAGTEGTTGLAAITSMLSTKATAGTAQPSATGLAGQAPLPTSTMVNTPFGDARWGAEMSNRITWLANEKIQSAEIRLNPERLGPVELRIEFKDDQARIVFASQHAVVRDAIESAMPRLREMMNSQGLNLADAQVTDQSLQDQRSRGDGDGDGQGGEALAGGDGNAGDEHDSGGSAGQRQDRHSESIISETEMNIDFYA